MKENRFHVGLRTIKTIIASYLCFVVDYLRGGVGMPFYGVIAAILCIQKDMSSSLNTGKNRMIATFIGSIFGALYLFLEQNLISFNHALIRYAVLCLILIPVIYFSVMIKQRASTFLSCVVFLSVTLNHAHEGPLEFATTRLIDTGIGIVIALFVNWALFKIVEIYHKFK